MTTLIETIKAVSEKNLSKEQLESYYDSISILLAQLNMEAGDLEKEEALFLANRENTESIASRKVAWKATAPGQRLIVVKRYISAVKSLLSSIKNRIYSNL